MDDRIHPSLRSALGHEGKRRMKFRCMRIGADFGFSLPPKSRKALLKMLTKKYGEEDARRMMRQYGIPVPSKWKHWRKPRKPPFVDRYEEHLRCEEEALASAGLPSLSLSPSFHTEGEETLDFGPAPSETDDAAATREAIKSLGWDKPRGTSQGNPNSPIPSWLDEFL